MPKAPPPPTKVHLAADALIAAPRATTFAGYRTAIQGIRKIYYAALGAARRRALRARLDEHLDGLAALVRADPSLVARARHVLPPAYLPTPAKKSAPKKSAQKMPAKKTPAQKTPAQKR